MRCQKTVFASYSQNYHCRYSTGWKITSFGKIRRLISVKKAFDCTFSTVVGAGGTQVHVLNVYGWPPGTPDLWKN